MEISHKEFITILKEKDKYENMKENVSNVNEKQENMRLNSVNSRVQVLKKNNEVMDNLHNWWIWPVKKLASIIFFTMYRMSSKAERLTQERKIAVEKYSETKIRTTCVNERGANDLYVIPEKNEWFAKNVGLQNLCHLA